MYVFSIFSLCKSFGLNAMQQMYVYISHRVFVEKYIALIFGKLQDKINLEIAMNYMYSKIFWFDLIRDIEVTGSNYDIIGMLMELFFF